VAGTQEETLKAAGRTLRQAKNDLAAAKQAPYTGSATSQALRDATTRHTQAQGAFDSAYTAYHTSMVNARQNPSPKTDFIPN
jgi:hypothetical protein